GAARGGTPGGLPVKVAGVELHDPRPVSGGDICRAVRATTADGRPVFAKTLDAAPDRFFAAEADGLAMLRVPGGPPVPDVVAVGADGLVLSWVEPGRPRDDAAEAFGRALAALHRDAPPSFGAQQDGFLGSLPLPNTPAASWPELY